MAIKYKGKDFTKLTGLEIDEWLNEKVYMKPKATFKLNKKGKFIKKK